MSSRPSSSIEISATSSARMFRLANDTAVQRPVRKGAQRPKRPSACNGVLGTVHRSRVHSVIVADSDALGECVELIVSRKKRGYRVLLHSIDAKEDRLLVIVIRAGLKQPYE